MHLIARLIFGAFLGLLAGSVAAQDDTAAREAAVERYLDVVPMSTMLEDTFAEIAKQLPVNQRAAFVSQMRALVRVESIERVARDAMLRVFTADELNALADFYGSQHGASAMKKFGVYMADVLPAMQAEIQRAAQQMNSPAAAPSR